MFPTLKEVLIQFANTQVALKLVLMDFMSSSPTPSMALGMSDLALATGM